MNKETLLQMTTKEIALFLNNAISDIDFESESATEVKGKMIDSVKTLFDDSIEVSIPYYTNSEISIRVGRMNVTFKVGAKKTGKTVEVSRLRKKDIKTIGKFKFSDLTMSFNNPWFDADDLNLFKVKLSQSTCSGGASISLKHRKEKLIDMLSKNILLEEIQNQNDDWKDIRKTVILSAAQPKIKQAFFKSNFNQKDWDIILLKTEENNKELIDSEIEKIFNV